MKKTNLFFSLVIGMSLLSGSWADTTIDGSKPNAYGANVGWIDARGDVTHGAVMGQLFCTGYVWSANCGWICLGNGPTNGWQYSNASDDDWGVNHDGEGQLTGYAYGANVGWITFEQTQGLPHIDLRSGSLSGYAWSANVGWIGFSNTEAYVQSTLSAGPDTDGDGIPDAWERRRTGGLTALEGSGADADGDHIPDVAEYVADTDPLTDEHFSIVSLTAANGTNTVAWSSRPSRLYRVEATNALPVTAGEWRDAAGGLIGPPGSSPTQAAIPQAGTTTQFYRVQAVVPLAE
jgi:hypothetical protein